MVWGEKKNRGRGPVGGQIGNVVLDAGYHTHETNPDQRGHRNQGEGPEDEPCKELRGILGRREHQPFLSDQEGEVNWEWRLPEESESKSTRSVSTIDFSHREATEKMEVLHEEGEESGGETLVNLILTNYKKK